MNEGREEGAKPTFNRFCTSQGGASCSLPPYNGGPTRQSYETKEQPKRECAGAVRCAKNGTAEALPPGSSFVTPYRGKKDRYPHTELSKSNSPSSPPSLFPRDELLRKSPTIKSASDLAKSPSQVINGVHTNKRTRLLVFIKIILKCLDYEDPSLHLEAKQIITECTRKNREGIPGYDSLSDAITRQLRMAVGEVHWNRAENLMSHYLKTRSKNSAKIHKPNYAAV
mmetsp:Transcript_4597/g.10176  ORF Transcript_4597/g.10176 Transcript_4597/m.10176 type:complete len:226 (+) Transcript_4597:125-802(+)